MMKRLCCLLGIVAALSTAPAQAQSEPDALWSLLERGGHVVLVRHGLTTPGLGDPPAFRLDDCATQRNMTDEGRAETKRLGDAFRSRGIRVDEILSSPWCRCQETARIAFRPAKTWPALGNLFGRLEAREPQVREMHARLGERRTGGNVVWVTHGSTIAAATGVSPDTAEIVVVTPKGGGKFEVAGRLKVSP